MRNFKKVVAAVMVCFFAMSSVSFAAIGSKKFSAPKKPRVSTQQKAKPAETKPNNDYKPSQNAKSLDKNAPAAGAKSNAQAAAQKPQGSMMGNMMRNIGLFAGGMMLGSLLGSMFGMGEGLFADILGMLANVVILLGIFLLGRMLWNKFRNKKKKEEENIYRMRR